MKLFVIAFLAIAAVSGIPLEDKTIKCTPGTLVKQDCNDCVCSPDGSSFGACTLMLCESTGTTGKARARREASEKVCEPGDTKAEDCNTCFCLDDGSGWGCTLKACLPQFCQPGTQYKKDCNTCACNQDGTAEMCTRKACPKNAFNVDGSLVAPSENGSKNSL